MKDDRSTGQVSFRVAFGAVFLCHHPTMTTPFDGLCPATAGQWIDLRPDGITRDTATGRTRVSLRIEEPSGLTRIAHPVTSGVPIGEGELRDEPACRLLDETGN